MLRLGKGQLAIHTKKVEHGKNGLKKGHTLKVEKHLRDDVGGLSGRPIGGNKSCAIERQGLPSMFERRSY